MGFVERLPLHDAGAAQGFQAPDVGRDDFLRIAAGHGLNLRDGEVMVGTVWVVRIPRTVRRSLTR
jgi:hypothetical protein